MRCLGSSRISPCAAGVCGSGRDRHQFTIGNVGFTMCNMARKAKLGLERVVKPGDLPLGVQLDGETEFVIIIPLPPPQTKIEECCGQNEVLLR